MSLNERTKRQLDDMVNLIEHKMDDKIQDAKDSISVELQKDRFKGGTSNNLGLILKRNKQGINDVITGKQLSHSFELKASDITTGSGSGSYVLEDYVGERDSMRSFFDLASLFPRYNVNGGIARVVTQNSRDGQFDIVAEGSASTQSDVQFKEVNVALETIRSFGVLSNELIQDSSNNLESFVRQNFLQELIKEQNEQLINGSGNINSLNANKTDLPTDSNLIFYQSVNNAQNIDVLKAVIGQMQSVGMKTDLIIISPKMMFELQFVKDANNNYISGLDVVAPDYARFNGVNIYSTEQLTGDIGFALDTQKFGILCTKNVFDAKITSEGKDALVNNVAYLGMQSRMNLAILSTGANYKFDFSSTVSALETP